MGLSSIFKRNREASAGAGQPRGRSAPAPAPEPSDEVQRARTRARQRLIGAVVLLGIGVVGFPLVFETQPRPVPVDIPIEIPRKEGAPPLVLAPTRPVDPGEAARSSPAVPTPSEDVVTEARDEAAHGVPGRAADAAPRSPSVATRSTPEAKRTDSGDGARAQALLEGKSPTVPSAQVAPAAPASAAAARFVVQVGAFADAGAAQDTRLKVEKLGLKTYTQVASTAAGGRIRVRVGPFASRDEADRALAKARGAGLSAVVITL